MTTTTDRSLLRVSEVSWREVTPIAATVHARLVASKLFSGRAALTTAVELRRLVAALAARGVDEDAVVLAGATLDVSSGLFSKSSSVTYRVDVRIDELERVAAVLDAITDCKDASIVDIGWDYPRASTLAELLAEGGARAAAKARQLATALGVTLVAIRAVDEDPLEAPTPPPIAVGFHPQVAMRGRARSSIAGELAGLELAPTQPVGVRVSLTYEIAPAG